MHLHPNLQQQAATYLHSKRTAVDVNPFLYNELGCAHEWKAHGLQWVELIGMVIKSTVIVMLVGLAKRIMKPDFQRPGQISCA